MANLRRDARGGGGADVDVALLGAILDLLPGAVGLWDRRLVNLYASKSVINWFRQPAHEVHGKHLTEVLGPAADRISAHIEGVFRGEPQVLEERIPTPDGGVKVAHVTYTPNIVDGSVEGFVVFAIDITDRAQAQMAIRRDTEQAALFELRQSVAADIDQLVVAKLDKAVGELDLVRAAPSAADDALIESALSLIDETIIDLRSAVTRLRQTTPPRSGSWNLGLNRLAAGTETTPRVLPAGALDSALECAAAAPGIRTRVGSADARDWLPADLAALADHLPGVIAMFDMDLNLVYANRVAAVSMALDDSAAASGRHAKHLFGPEAYAANHAYIDTALQGTPARFERSLIEPGGVRYTQAVYQPMHDGDEITGVVVVINEFAARGNDHPQLRVEIENEVLRPERYRIAEDFHDLVIQRLFAAALATDSALREPADRAHRIGAARDSIRNAIAEARASIHNLKAAANATDLPVTVAAVVQHATSTLGFSPTITYIGSPRDAPAGVAAELVAVLTEALSNTARHARATSVDVTISTNDDEVSLVVADDGVGVGDHPPTSGLLNMQSRAERLRGSFRSYPNHPSGLVIEWTAPI